MTGRSNESVSCPYGLTRGGRWKGEMFDPEYKFQCEKDNEGSHYFDPEPFSLPCHALVPK